jgi:membrane fusion protein (multidrug efflux system)
MCIRDRALLLAGSAFAWYWTTTLRFIEKTDNAYVRSEITLISSKVQGYVTQVPVEDNMPVSAGTVLARIEDVEYKARLENGRQKLEERKGALQVAQSKTRQQHSRIEACRAQLAAAEAEQGKRNSDLRRFDGLVAKGIVSAMDYDGVATAAKKSSADAGAARAVLETTEKELDVLLAEQRRLEAEIRQQEAELKLLTKECSDTVVVAPISGVVGNRKVRPGQFVKPGSQLMAVIPREDVWVEANFKEIQLTRMHEGQPVGIEVDTFPGSVLLGRVESLSPASGAEYSLIPPENAAGNFTKIVQRIAVKIRFEPGQPLLKGLRSGMSAVVSLDTRGGSLPSAARR